jgi:hypothetical protein
MPGELAERGILVGQRLTQGGHGNRPLDFQLDRFSIHQLSGGSE